MKSGRWAAPEERRSKNSCLLLEQKLCGKCISRKTEKPGRAPQCWIGFAFSAGIAGVSPAAALQVAVPKPCQGKVLKCAGFVACEEKTGLSSHRT
jgi:hypothetical protein